jgi:hypothetical protein
VVATDGNEGFDDAGFDDAPTVDARAPFPPEDWDAPDDTGEDRGRDGPPRVSSAAVRATTPLARAGGPRLRRHGLLAVTVAVGVVVAVVAAIAAIALAGTPPARWVPVLQDVLKTAYQALALGALGGLAKLFIDRRRGSELAAAQLRDRQRGFISAVTRASHDVDRVRLLVRANRSVKTWTECITGPVVVAWTSLRGISHDLTNWEEAGQPVFDDSRSIGDQLRAMCDYLQELIDEHAQNKQRLGELQRTAGILEGTERQGQLALIWHELEELPQLSDLLRFGEGYGGFRDAYLGALRLMRTALALPVPERRA